MRLSALLENLGLVPISGPHDTEITAATDDSRLVEPGALFVARRGHRVDGRGFVDEAVQRGAVAVLTDGPIAVPEKIALLSSTSISRDAAIVAERFHNSPSRSLQLIGVTGTNGKTTTTYLIRHIFTTAGVRCGMIGTVEVDDGCRQTRASLTTPGAFEISGLLARMVENDCHTAVIEVSSHALAQHRVDGLAIDAGVFTNLSGDHLDYHGTMDAYAKSKAHLFALLNDGGVAIANTDDEHSPIVMSECTEPIIQTSIAGQADWRAKIVQAGPAGSNVIIESSHGIAEFFLPLVGRHNVSNALQAIAVAVELGVGFDAAISALKSCTAPPGRFESVGHGAAHLPTVLVDYAHTDAALDQALATLRPLVPPGARLMVVFGCGGDRDRTKRPRMAQAACRYADSIVITSDNPRTEDPNAIIDDIVQGAAADQIDAIMIEPDRQRAILDAIGSAREGDIVLIAGKGHEDYQIVGSDRIHFDDREVAAAALVGKRGEVVA